MAEEKEKKGFFQRLVAGLSKTRANIVSGIDSIFSGYSSIKGTRLHQPEQGGQRPLQGYNETFYPYQRESSEYQLHPGRMILNLAQLRAE